MKTVGAFEAKNTLGSLLDLVEKGEEVVITRRGKRVARLVPDRTPADRERALKAAKDLLALGHEMNLGPFDWEEWKALRDEGRR
jgi:prevent-host-death family protein